MLYEMVFNMNSEYVRREALYSIRRFGWILQEKLIVLGDFSNVFGKRMRCYIEFA